MGLTFAENNADEVIDAMREQSIKALEECGLIAEGYAIENITSQGAIDTGNLRNSIGHKVIEEEKAVYIGTNTEYAPYVEFGTGIYVAGGRQTPWTFQDSKGEWHRTNGMKPRPFLKPAISEHAEEYEQIIQDNLSS